MGDSAGSWPPADSGRVSRGSGGRAVLPGMAKWPVLLLPCPWVDGVWNGAEVTMPLWALLPCRGCSGSHVDLATSMSPPL